MSDWFETWFDSKYYHLLYANRDDKEAQKFIQALIAHLQLPQGSAVLDLACGKGRHARMLHELGFEVTGMDLSEMNIKLAKEESADEISFIQQDMREEIPNYQCDLVVNLFTSFGYFDDINDNYKVLESIYNMLAPKGKLIIDFFNADWVKSQKIEKGVCHKENVSFSFNKKIENGFIVKEIVFEDKNIGKTGRYKESVQLLSQQDFENLLQESGFRIVNIFGDYQLGQFSSASERLIIEAEKVD